MRPRRRSAGTRGEAASRDTYTGTNHVVLELSRVQEELVSMTNRWCEGRKGGEGQRERAGYEIRDGDTSRSRRFQINNRVLPKKIRLGRAWHLH